ncbi:hypothetical protein TrRE_jg13197 [Triparma retinervis]|uniref:Uncharacterized protein n=1 Tax=Triparma retinervis TaxID=2557542 RepID=A0A9W6ZHN2_9STRA|nr:hypothetical protein TrRE_jg13197 [Triparma retinervis]
MKLFSIFSLIFLSTSIVALPSTPSFVVAKTTNVVLREEVDVNRLGMDLVGKVGRGGALVTKEQFLMADIAVNLLYGVQMLLAPGKLVTDHFNSETSNLLNFFIRGSSVGFLGLAYFLHKSTDGELNHKVALGTAIATGVLYPWNAKLNTALALPIKYPMHYVPEVIFILLTIAGIASGME